MTNGQFFALLGAWTAFALMLPVAVAMAIDAGLIG